MPKQRESPDKCGNCMMWGGSLALGPCMWEVSPVYLQERWNHDKPVCLEPAAKRLAALIEEGE